MAESNVRTPAESTVTLRSRPLGFLSVMTRTDYEAKIATLESELRELRASIVGGEDVGMSEGLYLSATKGSLRTGIYGGHLQHWDANGQLVKYPPVPAVPAMHQNFLDCIRSGQEPNCPFELGFRVSIACRMAVESYRQQRAVRWDTAREEIV